MSDNKLKMNNDKTELIAIGTKSKINQITPNCIPVSLSGYDIPISLPVKKLGFYFDETFSIDAQIKRLCRIQFCQLSTM